MLSFKAATLALAATLCAAAPAAAATLVNVQFTGPQRSVGAQVGKAIVGSAGDSWNQLFGNSSSGASIALNDARSVASGYSLTYSANGVYSSDPTYTKFTGTPVANLMQGYLYGQDPITATISGLKANQGFTLYAITQGDNNTANRRNDLTVNGQSISTLNTNASSFIEGDNYAVFSGRANALGEISLSDARGAGEANLNGFQLSATVPEPATWAMMIAGVGGVGGALRRRRVKGGPQLRTA